MNFFATWFEKHFCRIQEGHGSNVGKILNLLNATSMTSPASLSTLSLTSHF
jgi:hypothetical protein